MGNSNPKFRSNPLARIASDAIILALSRITTEPLQLIRMMPECITIEALFTRPKAITLLPFPTARKRLQLIRITPTHITIEASFMA